jgi:hypothetical protein
MELADRVSASLTARTLGKLRATQQTAAAHRKVSEVLTGPRPTLAQRPAQTVRIVRPGPAPEPLQTPEARAQLATPIVRLTREAIALTNLRSAPRLPTIEDRQLLVRIPRPAAPIRLPAAITRPRAATIPHQAVPTRLRPRAAVILLPAVLTQLQHRAAVIRPPAALTQLPAALTLLLAAALAAEAADLVAVAAAEAVGPHMVAAADLRTAVVAAVVAPIDNSFLSIQKGPPLSGGPFLLRHLKS